MTRNRQQVTSTYPEIADALWAQEASGFIVDGEIVAFVGNRTSFSRLQRRLGVSGSVALVIEEPDWTSSRASSLRTSRSGDAAAAGREAP